MYRDTYTHTHLPSKSQIWRVGAKGIREPNSIPKCDDKKEYHHHHHYSTESNRVEQNRTELSTKSEAKATKANWMCIRFYRGKEKQQQKSGSNGSKCDLTKYIRVVRNAKEKRARKTKNKIKIKEETHTHTWQERIISEMKRTDEAEEITPTTKNRMNAAARTAVE